MLRRSLLRALPLSFLAGGAQAKPRTLDLACYYDHALGEQAVQLFAATVTEVSSGALDVSVEVLPATMPFEMISKATALANYCAPMFANVAPVFGLSAVPMLARTFDEAGALLGIARPYYGAGLARHGQVLLATHPWRPAALWSTFRIGSSADIKGAEFALGDPSYSSQAATWQEPFLRLGVRKASPLNAELVLSNAYRANSIFAQEFAAFTEIFFTVQLSFLTVSQAVFDTLSEAHRQMLVAAGRKTEGELWKRIREFVARDHQDIASRGVLVAPEPPGDLGAALQRAAEPEMERWASAVGADGASILTQYRTIGRRH